MLMLVKGQGADAKLTDKPGLNVSATGGDGIFESKEGVVVFEQFKCEMEGAAEAEVCQRSYYASRCSISILFLSCICLCLSNNTNKDDGDGQRSLCSCHKQEHAQDHAKDC